MMNHRDVTTAGRALAFTLVLAVALPADAARKITCTNADDGVIASRETTTRLKRKPLVQVTDTVAYNRATEEATSTAALMRGSRSVFESETHTTRGAIDRVAQRFGFGFRGISEVVVGITDGGVQVTVDGRVARFDGSTVTFDDGQPPPTLRAKRSIARLLRKLQRRPAPTCPDPRTLSRDEINDPFENECETCHSTCFLKGDACFAGKILACALGPLGCGAAFVAEFFGASLSCGEGLVQCTEGCNALGHECCRIHCGDNCCGSIASGRTDYMCAGANSTFAGTCCFPEDTCGGACCGYRIDFVEHPTPTKQACADPAKNLCCDSGANVCGNGCCNAPFVCKTDPFDQRKVCTATDSDPCGAFACPDGKRCQHASTDVDEIQCITCPADKTGPVCGDTCCAANEVCGFGNTCCAADHLCGGTCCANMADCLNGTTCCDSTKGGPCGNSCCPLGNDCCNGQCCIGTCVANSICCSALRQCGTEQCCALNQTCDTNTNTCMPCGCPDGQECCPGGTQSCCIPPLVCCQPEAKPAGCYTVNECLNLR